MLMTVLYIIATLSLVILSNQNILENDTNRVLKTIDQIQLFLEKHPDLAVLLVYSDDKHQEATYKTKSFEKLMIH